MSKCRKTIRGLSLVFMTVILFLSSVISVYGTDTEGSGTSGASYVPGEVLVMYREDVSEAVSYTHLDVYKRQPLIQAALIIITFSICL